MLKDSEEKIKNKDKEIDFTKSKSKSDDNSDQKLIDDLNNLKGLICLNNSGKSYYVSEYSIIDETTRKVEEKYFFQTREVDEIVPEFINEIVTISGSNKISSFSFDENGKNIKIPYYTIEDVIYNFMVDRERYLKTKESLSELGIKVEE
jgi:hypothetical protein